MTAPNRARLEELLAVQAIQKLTPKERTELEALLTAFPEYERDMFELAAAAVHLALIGEPDELPAGLEEKLHLTAVALTPAPPPLRLPKKPAEGRRGPSWLAWSGWAIAAGLAGVLVYQLSQPPVKPDDRPPPQVVELTLEQKRDALKKDAPAKPAMFAANQGNAAGNVVWSDVKQEGYLEIRGLPPNDPAKEKYQLWIFDGARGKAPAPISAGLFDVKPGAPTLVRVNASLPVGDAAAFAISKEQPNGGPQPNMEQVVLVMPAKAG